MPEMNLDPVLVAAHIIVAAQQIVSRRANPKTPSVLSFGKVIANGATNVIPNEVYLEGTFRTLNEEWRNEAHRHLRKLCEGRVDETAKQIHRCNSPIDSEAIPLRIGLLLGAP